MPLPPSLTEAVEWRMSHPEQGICWHTPVHGCSADKARGVSRNWCPC